MYSFFYLIASLQVSPQFRNTEVSGGGFGKRQTRLRRRHSVATNRMKPALHMTDFQNNTVLNRPCKYRALKFLGDKSRAQSVMEDVHISFETDTASENECGGSNINKIDENCSLQREVHRRKSLKRYKKSEFDSLPIDTTDPQNNYPAETQRITDCCVSVPPIKRLFASQLPQTEGQSNNTGDCQDMQKKPALPVGLVDSDDAVSETSLEDGTSPAVRRSQRLQLLQSQKGAQIHAQILAPDTPESEYGWSMRHRQLRRHLK